MQSALYQLAMVIGVGTLGVLLLRGYSLTTALFRSGIVLITAMIMLLMANALLSWIMTPTVRNDKDFIPTDIVTNDDRENSKN